MKCGIYGLKNKTNGKWYIGQSINIERRWHRAYKLLQCKKQRKIYHALLKYGYDGFERIILEECPKELFKQRETYWINKYNSVNEGYNMAPGGEGGCRPVGIPCSEETKRKISEANKGKVWTNEMRQRASEQRKGKPKPDGFGEKVSATLTGVPLTEERKRNISLARKGHTWSEERKKAWSLSKIGVKRGPYKKRLSLQALE